MKSREGTVVDADDLMAEMINTAHETSQELEQVGRCNRRRAAAISRMVGLGALKYFILKVDPKKNMTFNPKESIDFNGNTAPSSNTPMPVSNRSRKAAADQGITTPEKLEKPSRFQKRRGTSAAA